MDAMSGHQIGRYEIIETLGGRIWAESEEGRDRFHDHP